MDIMFRREAKKQGMEFYFTGKPCVRGKVARRRTSNGVCQCESCLQHVHENELRRSRYATDEAYRENKKAIAKRSRDRNKERTREWARSYRERNRDSVNAASRNWYTSKPEDERKEYSKTKYYKNLVRTMLNNAKSRAKKHGTPFNLSPTDIIVPEACPVLGIPLIWGLGTGRMNDNSPSLDKINPVLGYVVGNVCVISWRANRLKSDATLQELQAVCEYVANNKTN